MRCFPNLLSQQLKKSNLSTYCLFGNEPFLIEQSANLIRQKVRAAAVDVEHIVINFDSNNSIGMLSHSEKNRSLFTQKRLFEITLKKITSPDVQALAQILETKDQESTFLILAGQLTRPQQQAKWFTSIEQHGLVVPHWPLTPFQFLKWVEERALQQGLKLQSQALRLLAYYTEGNCLSAAQEIDRLSLYYADSQQPQEITDLDQQSQFTVFDLCEAALEQQSARVIKIVSCLKESQSAPLQLIIWALIQSLRALLRCTGTGSEAHHRQLLQQAGIRAQAFDLYLKVLKAGSSAHWTSLLARLSLADKQLKTGETMNAWRNALSVSLSFGAHPILGKNKF